MAASKLSIRKVPRNTGNVCWKFLSHHLSFSILYVSIFLYFLLLHSLQSCTEHRSKLNIFSSNNLGSKKAKVGHRCASQQMQWEQQPISPWFILHVMFFLRVFSQKFKVSSTKLSYGFVKTCSTAHTPPLHSWRLHLPTQNRHSFQLTFLWSHVTIYTVMLLTIFLPNGAISSSSFTVVPASNSRSPLRPMFKTRQNGF